MKTQKGSAIIIISIIAALIFFVAAASVGGYFVYKYYFAEEEEEEDEDKDKGSSEKIIRDEQGFIDCGRVDSSLEDFDDPFFDVDFDKDNAFVCMGKNIKNSCSKAKSVMDIGGIDLVYKSTGTSSFNCNIRFEVNHPDQGSVWAECPLSSLTSFARDYATSSEEFNMILDKMEQGDGDYGASMFALMAIALEFNMETFEQMGCSRSE